MMDLDLGFDSTSDGEEVVPGPRFTLQAIHGECKQIGFGDGIRAEIVSREGGEGNIVGFLSLKEAGDDPFKLYVDRFQMAPLEAYKRSLICGFLLDELASKRTISELTVDTYDWADKEGDNALSKIKPFAGFAEKRNMNLYVTMRMGEGAAEEKIDPSILRGFSMETAQALVRIRLQQRFA